MIAPGGARTELETARARIVTLEATLTDLEATLADVTKGSAHALVRYWLGKTILLEARVAELLTVIRDAESQIASKHNAMKMAAANADKSLVRVTELEAELKKRGAQ